MKFNYITNTGIAIDNSGNEIRDENGAAVIVPADERANYDIAFRSDGSEQKAVTLPDGDYKAEDYCNVWIDVRGFTVNLKTTDEGIVVDVFNAEQMRTEPYAEPVASTYAFDHELA
jgi:flagellar hook assembly protein FlgD